MVSQTSILGRIVLRGGFENIWRCLRAKNQTFQLSDPDFRGWILLVPTLMDASFLESEGTTFGEELVEEVSLLRGIERQVSWGISQSRVDGGCAINVCEVATAVGGAESAGAGSW